MLRLENIQLLYGKRKILEHVNLDFRAGEITSIIGINGSGKSTLLRVCAGRLAPGGGQVFLREEGKEEQDLSVYAPKELAKRIAIPVSYTHLDVYKRQTKRSAAFAVRRMRRLA